MRKELEKFIPNPSQRSAKWVNSANSNNNNLEANGSVDQNLCSAEYIANSVYQNEINFDQAFHKIQANDIIIEIGPNAMLPDILEDSDGKKFHVTSLFCKDDRNTFNNFFSKLAKIYMKGFDLDLMKLYPPISFPVSRGTPSISSKIKWNHYKDWYVCQEADLTESQSGENEYMIQTKDPKYESITGHVIDGK